MTATMERAQQEARETTIALATGDLQPGDTFPIPSEGAFEIPDLARHEDDDPEYADYIPAPPIERIAAMLIARHGHLDHLREANIAYRWKREGGKVGGKVRFGSCRRLDAVGRHFAGADFLIAIGADNCRANRFTVRNIEALVFHELCHIAQRGTDEEPKLVLAPHDFEGFTAEWAEYGPWHPDLKRLAKVVQPMLPGVGA